MICSTDDKVIIKYVNKKYPDIICKMRTAELANDSAKMIDVLRYTREALISDNIIKESSSCITLQPTCPLRTSFEIEKVYDLFGNSGYQSAATICEAFNEPHDLIIKKENGYEGLVSNELLAKGYRQAYNKSYFVTGSIYVHKAEWIMKESQLWSPEETLFVSLDQDTGIDIDSSFQLELVKAYMESKGRKRADKELNK